MENSSIGKACCRFAYGAGSSSMKEGFKLLQRVLSEKDTSIIGDQAGSVYALLRKYQRDGKLSGTLIEQRRLMPLF